MLNEQNDKYLSEFNLKTNKLKDFLDTETKVFSTSLFDRVFLCLGEKNN